ncbi:MAG: hypothetical protein M3N42_13180 [Cyanobacteriota bacterium]|nr:hypothetical protein [Cyanobacteriota bacterium]
MQKTNATDKYVKIIAFIPSQPFGAQPQKPEAKSKANVTLKVIINPNIPIILELLQPTFYP